MKRKKAKVSRGGKVYTLDVHLMGGPITKRFAKENPNVSRTIEIRGDQTLQRLHQAIFKAFDRKEDHVYEFQVGGKGPDDPAATCYSLRSSKNCPCAKYNPPTNVKQVSVGSIGLKKGDRFAYWFTFGDSWWHQIMVKEIGKSAGKGTYPKVTARIGESPPQYVDWEKEAD